MCGQNTKVQDFCVQGAQSRVEESRKEEQKARKVLNELSTNFA